MAAKKKKARAKPAPKKKKDAAPKKKAKVASSKRGPLPKKKVAAKKRASAAPKKNHREVNGVSSKPTLIVEVATIVQEEIFDAAPMDVYEALVDPAKHAQFTGSMATGEPIEGGTFTAWDGYIAGRHERLVPGARIVQLWRTTEFPHDHPDSRLELREYLRDVRW